MMNFAFGEDSPALRLASELVDERHEVASEFAKQTQAGAL